MYHDEFNPAQEEIILNFKEKWQLAGLPSGCAVRRTGFDAVSQTVVIKTQETATGRQKLFFRHLHEQKYAPLGVISENESQMDFMFLPIVNQIVVADFTWVNKGGNSIGVSFYSCDSGLLMKNVKNSELLLPTAYSRMSFVELMDKSKSGERIYCSAILYPAAAGNGEYALVDICLKTLAVNVMARLTLGLF